MPKSEQFWRWKHIENPFGQSPVLVCWENNVLIGVRAFMRWEWIMDGRVYRTVRAVDTATHPDHQGKGIFRKLTLSLVDKCEKEGVDFVFNTPNLKSKPGYLKMGWSEAGQLPIRVSIQPLNLVRRAMNGLEPIDETHLDHDSSILNRPDLDRVLEPGLRESGKLTTNVTSKYLKWRYIDVPVAKYLALGSIKENSLDELSIVRVKMSKVGCELRVVDTFGRSDKTSKEMTDHLRRLRRNLRSDFSTASGLNNSPFVVGRPSISINRGPIVTIRPLACKNVDFLFNFNGWSPSIGDLELF